MKKRLYKERRVYFFRCSGCKKDNCKSYYKRRQRKELCRTCIRRQPDPNQLALIGVDMGIDEGSKTVITERASV